MAGDRRAVDALLSGGIVAYPTEGVFGLGCLPQDATAVERLLALKRRDPAKGLILLAADAEQLDGWIALADGDTLPPVEPARPITWIVPPGPRVHPLLQGSHDGIAVRLSANPTAAALCRAVGSPLTSTSANLSGRPVVRNKLQLRRQFGDLVDYIVPGDCGPASGPSEIRVLSTGKVLRPA